MDLMTDLDYKISDIFPEESTTVSPWALKAVNSACKSLIVCTIFIFVNWFMFYSFAKTLQNKLIFAT